MVPRSGIFLRNLNLPPFDAQIKDPIYLFVFLFPTVKYHVHLIFGHARQQVPQAFTSVKNVLTKEA